MMKIDCETASGFVATDQPTMLRMVPVGARRGFTSYFQFPKLNPEP